MADEIAANSMKKTERAVSTPKYGNNGNSTSFNFQDSGCKSVSISTCLFWWGAQKNVEFENHLQSTGLH